MIRGTRVITGSDAKIYRTLVTKFSSILLSSGYEEIILPALWEQQTFIDKAGPEIVNQMYVFKDKADRDICLIPEATALVQALYNEKWSKEWKKPVRVFYTQKCYRYENPQAGRYREFTQFGVERLGGNLDEGQNEVIDILNACLQTLTIEYKFNASVKRGLDYYIGDGFEVEVATLGAQKQIAGGGKYNEGVGFAIGIDRLLLALKLQEERIKGA